MASFLSNNYSWPWVPHRSEVDRSSDTPLEENAFSFSQWSSITNSFLVRSGASQSQCWDFAWLHLVHGSCMLSLSLWVYMCICPVVPGGCYFLGVIHHLWLSHGFCLLCHIHPWTLRGSLWQKHPIKPECSNLSYSRHHVHLWVSWFIIVYYKKLLWGGLSDSLIYGYTDSNPTHQLGFQAL